MLLEKLAIFPDEIDARHEIAQRYQGSRRCRHRAAREPEGYRSCGRSTRSASNSASATDSPPRVRPMGFRPRSITPAVALADCVSEFPVADGGLAVSERLAAEVISLPMHPYLDPATQDRIIDAGAPRIAELSLAEEAVWWILREHAAPRPQSSSAVQAE